MIGQQHIVVHELDLSYAGGYILGSIHSIGLTIVTTVIALVDSSTAKRVKCCSKNFIESSKLKIP